LVAGSAAPAVDQASLGVQQRLTDTLIAAKSAVRVNPIIFTLTCQASLPFITLYAVSPPSP